MPPWSQHAGGRLIAINKFLSWANTLQMTPGQLTFGSGLQSTVAVTQKYACTRTYMHDHFCVLTVLTVPERHIQPLLWDVRMWASRGLRGHFIVQELETQGDWELTPSR